MTIKALRPVVVSSTRSLGPGEIADDIPEHVARALLATGKAVPYTRPEPAAAPLSPPDPVASPVVETAAVQPVVETTTAKPRRQNRKP